MTDKEHSLYFYDKAYRFDYKAGVDTSGAKYWNFVGKTLLWKSYKRINEKTYGNHTKASMKKIGWQKTYMSARLQFRGALMSACFLVQY